MEERMATKKKKPKTKVDSQLSDLRDKRAVRKRAPGDKKGVDVSIRPGAFFSLEKHLKTLPENTRKKFLNHIQENVSRAMLPINKLVKKKGTQVEADLVADVGPNMLRTIIEFLEEET